MVFQHNAGNNMGFDGGGGIVALGAVVFAGWATWQLFWVAPVLTGVVVAYVVLVAAYWWALNDNYVAHRGFIKFLLVLSVLAAAGTVFFAFNVGLVRFVVGDAALVVLLVGALALGLWGVLNLMMRVVTVATLAVLIGAPFSETVEREEKWMVTAIVRDGRCFAVRAAEAKCQAIAAAIDVILDEKGPHFTDWDGAASFVFDGNALGKRARCEASERERGSGTGEADPSWYGAATVHIQLARAGEAAVACRDE
jgi:hypothetical protein